MRQNQAPSFTEKALVNPETLDQDAYQQRAEELGLEVGNSEDAVAANQIKTLVMETT